MKCSMMPPDRSVGCPFRYGFQFGTDALVLRPKNTASAQPCESVTRLLERVIRQEKACSYETCSLRLV